VSSTEFSLGHNVRSKAEVDAVMKEAAQAVGATVVKKAQDTFWGGYSGTSKARMVISGRSPGIHNDGSRTEAQQALAADAATPRG
jgi:hypothetical protein